MKLKRILRISLLILMVVILLSPMFFVLADEYGLDETAGSAGLQTNRTIPQIVGGVLQTVLSLLGLIALIIIIIGGFMWMTAGGNKETVEKARQLMLNGLIGLVIIVFSYMIATAVINLLTGQPLVAPATTTPPID